MQHALSPVTEKLQQVLAGDPFLPTLALRDLKSVWKDVLLSISQQKSYGWPLDHQVRVLLHFTFPTQTTKAPVPAKGLTVPGQLSTKVKQFSMLLSHLYKS